MINLQVHEPGLSLPSGPTPGFCMDDTQRSPSYPVRSTCLPVGRGGVGIRVHRGSAPPTERTEWRKGGGSSCLRSMSLSNTLDNSQMPAEIRRYRHVHVYINMRTHVRPYYIYIWSSRPSPSPSPFCSSASPRTVHYQDWLVVSSLKPVLVYARSHQWLVSTPRL